MEQCGKQNYKKDLAKGKKLLTRLLKFLLLLRFGRGRKKF